MHGPVGVTQCRADHRRWAFGVAGHVHDPRHRLGDVVVARPLGPRRGAAEARHRQVDDVGVHRPDRLVVEAPAGHDRRRAEVLAHDVGVPSQLEQQVPALRTVPVDAQALLAPVVLHEPGAVVALHQRQEPGGVADVGDLDLDDVGAQLGQHPGDAGAGQVLGEVEHRAPLEEQWSTVGLRHGNPPSRWPHASGPMRAGPRSARSTTGPPGRRSPARRPRQPFRIQDDLRVIPRGSVDVTFATQPLRARRRARMTSWRRVAAFTGALACAAGTVPLAMAAPAGAQSGPEVVASGLDNPRGMALTADGTLLVAEAGRGGAAPCLEGPEGDEVCFGLSGAITQVVGGVQSRRGLGPSLHRHRRGRRGHRSRGHRRRRRPPARHLRRHRPRRRPGRSRGASGRRRAHGVAASTRRRRHPDQGGRPR